MSVEVDTKRLRLRPVQAADLARLAEMFTDPEVMRFISGRPLRSTEIENIAEWSVRQWREQGYGPWSAWDRRSGAFVGRIGLNRLRDWPEADQIEVGWELRPEWWHRGLATEGARPALRLGFRDHKLPRIISVTRAEHAASRRVMERIGLRPGGTRHFRGVEVVVYGIDRLEWERQHAGQR